MASGATNDKTNSTSENIYLPKISSDTNANTNSLSTGAIPKSKINSTANNIPNGINSESRVKVNNNLHDVVNGKSDINGTCSRQLETYMQNNVEQEKQCIKSTGKIYNKSSNNYKSLGVTNGVSYNGSLNVTNQFNMHNQCPNDEEEQHFVNTLNRNSQNDRDLDLLLPNGVEAGPSTSREVNNIATPQRHKESESECSSDTGNDELSCSDDCCIYTYKGDVADLPSSFMNLDIPDNNDTQEQSRPGSRGSSPEMDFLEMDFDPGPSCDADSDDDSSINSDIKSEENPQNEISKADDDKESPQPSTSKEENQNTETFVIDLNIVSSRNNLSQENSTVPIKKEPELHNVSPHEHKNVAEDVHLQVNLTDEPWIPKCASNRTFFSSILGECKGHHSSSGDLISPNENVMPSISSLDCRVNSSSSLYHSTMEKQLVLDKQPSTSEEFVSVVEKTMIWSEHEAALKQITQIGTSACGATAILNVLVALGHPIPTNEKLLECVKTRLRKNFSPLCEYLISRSVAGSTHTDLIRGLHLISNGQIYGRFFHMYPERFINLSQWLCYWIKKGAVPIATLNLQKGVTPRNTAPDAWHHQMLFGVGPHGIYMTNPLEKVEEGVMWHQLSSESVLLVKREDIISRWNNTTNLKDLINIQDVRWHTLNVVGQVASVIREHHKLVSPHAVSRTHITIPAAYSAGITLVINVSNPAYELLKHCPELPILNMLP